MSGSALHLSRSETGEAGIATRAAIATFLWLLLVKAGLVTGAALATFITLLGDVTF